MKPDTVDFCVYHLLTGDHRTSYQKSASYRRLENSLYFFLNKINIHKAKSHNGSQNSIDRLQPSLKPSDDSPGRVEMAKYAYVKQK